MSKFMYICTDMNDKYLFTRFVEADNLKKAQETISTLISPLWHKVKELIEDVPYENPRIFEVELYTKNDGGGYISDYPELFKKVYVESNTLFDAWEQAEVKAKSYVTENRDCVWVYKINEIIEPCN